MNMLNLILLVMWTFTLQTNSEEITLQREIYDILLATFQSQHTTSDSHGIIQRLTSLEIKVQVYSEDRNQFLNYFKVTTDVLERLRKLEEENEFLKKSLSETIYKMEKMTNSTQETETKIQNLKKNMQNNLKETEKNIHVNIEEMTNVNRQRNIEHKNITSVLIKMSERIENIKYRQLEEHDNITDAIENIRYNLENMSSIDIQHEKLIFNLTMNLNDIQQSNGVMQEPLIYAKQQMHSVNETCLEAIIKLNMTAGRIKQNIDDLSRHMECVLNATHCTNERLKSKNSSHMMIYERSLQASKSSKHLTVSSTVSSTEFLTTTSPNTENYWNKFLLAFSSNFNSYKDRYVQCLISSSKEGWYTIDVPHLNIHENRSLIAGANVFNMSNALKVVSFSIENKGIFLEMSTNVTVFAMNIETYTSDGFYVIPLADLSTEYVIVSQEPLDNSNSYKSQITVVASENNTVINFKFHTNGAIYYKNKQYSNNENMTINLNQYETFEIDHVHDLTGTTVLSSKPIAVVSGNRCGTVVTIGCSHYSEMIQPVNSLDTRYIIPSFTSNFNDRIVRVVVAHNDTTTHFTIDGLSNSVKLNASDSIDKRFTKNTFMFLSTNKPALVAMFVNRQYGPFMTIIPGVNQYLSYYTFSVPSDEFTSSVSIIIKFSSVSGLRLDGTSFSTSCTLTNTTFGSENYCLMEKNVSPGIHNLFHLRNETFGLFVYGDRKYDSYGYYAGIKLN